MRRTKTRLVQIPKTSLQPPTLPFKLNPSRISPIPRLLGEFIVGKQIVDSGREIPDFLRQFLVSVRLARSTTEPLRTLDPSKRERETDAREDRGEVVPARLARDFDRQVGGRECVCEEHVDAPFEDGGCDACFDGDDYVVWRAGPGDGADVRFGLVQARAGPGAADGLVVVGLGAVEIHYGWRNDQVLACGGFPGCEGAVDDVEGPLDALGACDLEELWADLLVFGSGGRG